MNDIADMIGRFRDYLPDTSLDRAPFSRDPRAVGSRRRQLTFAAVSSIIGVVAAGAMVFTFVRSDPRQSSGFINHLSPSDRAAAVACIVHVPALEGQDQNDATNAALRVMVARATTFQWTAAEIVKLNASRISVTAPGGGCDAIKASLAAPFEISVIRLRDMQIVSADRLQNVVAQLPRTNRGLAYVAFQVDSATNWPFTLGMRAASVDEARADQGVPRSQVIAMPREFDVIGLPGTADTAEMPRRFAIYRYGANTVASGTDIIGTTAVDDTHLRIDLQPAAKQRIRAIATRRDARGELWLRFGNDVAQPEHGLIGSFDGTDFTVADAPMISRVVGGGNLVRSPQVDGPAQTAEQIPGVTTTLPGTLRDDALTMLDPGAPHRLPRVVRVLHGASSVFAFARDGSITESTIVVALRHDGGRDIASFCGQWIGYPALMMCRDVQPSPTRIIGRSAPSTATVVAMTDAGTTMSATPHNGWFEIPQPPNGTAITRLEALNVQGRPIGYVDWPLRAEFIPVPPLAR